MPTRFTDTSLVELWIIGFLLMQILGEILLYHSTGILDTFIPGTIFSENKEGKLFVSLILLFLTR